MLAAVQFDHQTVLKTNKVDNVRPDGLLPPEFAAQKLPVAQPTPEQPFRIGGTLAQTTRGTVAEAHGLPLALSPKGRGDFSSGRDFCSSR